MDVDHEGWKLTLVSGHVHHRPRHDQDRVQTGRQIPASYLRPAPVGRGHRVGLQATLRGRTRLAHPENHTRTAAGLPPPRKTHLILCWLALLLVRIIETTTGHIWHHLRDELDTLHVGTFTGPAGTYRQRTELTKPQRDILAKLDLTPPKKIVELTPAAA